MKSYLEILKKNHDKKLPKGTKFVSIEFKIDWLVL